MFSLDRAALVGVFVLAGCTTAPPPEAPAPDVATVEEAAASTLPPVRVNTAPS